MQVLDSKESYAQAGFQYTFFFSVRMCKQKKFVEI